MPKILIIDDDEQIRKLLRRYLEDEGHEVEDAATAVAGMKIFLEDRIDLVITDILMPGKDGIELITELLEKKSDVKIIAISGGGSCAPQLYLASSKYLGASLTLAKPFRREELLQAVNQLLEQNPNQV